MDPEGYSGSWDRASGNPLALQDGQKLEPVSERIVHIETSIARQEVVGFDFIPSCPQARFELVEISNEDPRMSLAGRLVVLLDTEMEFNPAVPKPGSTPAFQRDRFGQLLASEHVPIERAGPRF